MIHILIWLVSSMGYGLSKLPDRLLEALAWGLGRGIYWGFSSRRKLLLQSLAHAFPQYLEARRRKLAKESCKRTVEMAILGLVLPFWSKKELAKRFDFQEALTCLDPWIRAQQALVILTPHFSLMEALTRAPLFYKGPLPPMSVIYRPLNQPFLEKFIKKTRECGGMRLLSRKAGLLEALKILKNHGIVAVLFDQNAGVNGLETLFLDRPVYATELPQLLLDRSQAKPMFMYMERRGFGKGKLKAAVLDDAPQGGTIAPSRACLIQANAYLETLLKSDDALCADWLWLHKRWDMKRKPTERLCSTVKKSILSETLDLRDLKTIPRRRKVFIRLPNWLGDVVMMLPFLRALRIALPDAAVSLIGKAHFKALLDKLRFEGYDLNDHFIPLPEAKNSLSYWSYFWRLRKERPELHLLFTHSFRGDLEAFLIGATERFGIKKPRKCRPLLTHTWNQPASIDEAALHQICLWEGFLQYFGLKEPLSLAPFSLKSSSGSSLNTQKPKTLALICGTENSPEKRWPLAHWKALIHRIQEDYPDWKIILLGTAKDAAITQALAQNAKPNLEDLAGKTDLGGLMEVLQGCDGVVGNDTGGLHLANMLGVPVIGLYGPTNPIRTGPIYQGPYLPIQVKGQPMEAIEPELVFDKLKSFFST